MTQVDTILEQVFECAGVALDKRAADPLVLHVGALTSYTDYFLLLSGSSDRRVQTIAGAIRQHMKDKGVLPMGVEGLNDGRWALLDYGDWVAHIFYEEVRESFDLEGLWSDAKRIELPEELTRAARRAAEEEP